MLSRMSETSDHNVSPFVRKLLPGGSAEALREAQSDYEGYLDALIVIYKRLEAEAQLAVARDNSAARDKLNKYDYV